MFKRWRRQRVLEQASLPSGLWESLFNELPALYGLAADERRRLHDLVVLFLDEKEFIGADGLEITEAMRLYIAVLACLPILNLAFDDYADWTTLVVYPSEFRVHHHEHDEAGVEHTLDEERVGEAWEQGPLVLSWADVLQAGNGDGFNVVIHECAHKLDMQNGDTNGFPPLHRDMSPAAWTAAFSAAYASLCQQVEADEDTVLDPYASSSPAEFFAVASEAFFELPDELSAVYPAVYAQLRDFYRQDPLSRQVARQPLASA